LFILLGILAADVSKFSLFCRQLKSVRLRKLKCSHNTGQWRSQEFSMGGEV